MDAGIILQKIMVDKTEVKYRFKRNIETYDRYAAIQKQVVRHLSCLLENYLNYGPRKVLEIGCGTGLLTQILYGKTGPAEWTVNDLVEEMCRKTVARLKLPFSSCLPGDIESVALPQDYDLIVSASTFQWFNDPQQVTVKLAARLKKGGLLAFSTFGRNNLYELKHLTGRGLNYPSITDWENWLSPEFEILHAEERKHILYFRQPLQILQHLKYTGVNGVNSSEIWTRGRLQQFCADYRRFFEQGLTYPLTYYPLYMIGRKK